MAKKPEDAQSDAAAPSAAGKTKSIKRSYPRAPLETCMKVALILKEKNGGNPWPPTEVAKALGLSEKSSNLDLYTASGSQYQIIEGSRYSDNVSLTSLGREIVYADSSERELAGKRSAFLSIEVFRKVLEHYGGNNLPEKQYLSNTLLDKFQIPLEIQDEFVAVFQSNCNYTKIGQSWSASMPDSRGRIDHSLPVIRTDAINPSGNKCFVIMPLAEREGVRSAGFFREVYESLIKPAVTNAGFGVETALRTGSDLIHSTIINELYEADIVLADITDHNPNVLFELGLRLAENKPVAIIKSDDTGRIFDVDNLIRVWEYDANLWPSTVVKNLSELEEHIKATWAKRSDGRSYIDMLRGR
ncbi:MAG: hypothetical protein J0J06_01095 [Sphingomonas sp.]|uniref:hypothetical protein n=1 Tax=Sphingomonas sp. TaxID=28214 RepID=UPI001AD0E579|nr:hypothetical protein [Sphingomonas sp.]MBN8814024.1 hypothetical protein [Sphingomonas sp.]